MVEALLSPDAVYSARPAVQVDGRSHDELRELMIALELTESEGGLSRLELRLSNVASDPMGGAAAAFEDERIVGLGSRIEVALGDEAAPHNVFSGTVTGLELELSRQGPPELVVLAEDALQSARMARRSAVYRDMSIADIVREVAGRLGLTARVDAVGGGTGTQLQWNESDLAFLRRILLRHDADVQVIGRELHVAPRHSIRRGEVELELFSQLRRVRILADLNDQASRVTAAGWNALQGQRVSASSTGAHAGPGTGRTGAAILRDKLGERAEHVGDLAVTTSEEAQALADAAFDRRARRFVVVEGTAEGNALLRVGTHASLQGISNRFDGTYYVVRTCHRFDVRQGYETDFEAESAFLGEA